MKHIVLLLALAITFAGCQKIAERYQKYWGTPPSVKPCKIDSIYPVEKGTPAYNTWTAVGVKYNQKGNPVLLNYRMVYYGEYTFAARYHYDNRDRLIKITIPNSDTLPDYFDRSAPLHIKYVYEGNSTLPVRDTVFKWFYETVAEVEDLYYDEKGRINKVVHRQSQYPFPETYETKYQYDANGNKQVLQAGDGSTPPAIVYGDKPSLYSLHPIWQQVFKDYSKNAVAANVESFNERGLPLVVDLETYHAYTDQAYHNPTFLNIVTGPQHSLSHIQYKCTSVVK